jgi:hypothetical protein
MKRAETDQTKKPAPKAHKTQQRSMVRPAVCLNLAHAHIRDLMTQTEVLLENLKTLDKYFGNMWFDNLDLMGMEPRHSKIEVKWARHIPNALIG